MPSIPRPARVTIKVTEDAKRLAQDIAAALTAKGPQKWSETDVWEAGIAALAKTKEVREALSSVNG